MSDDPLSRAHQEIERLIDERDKSRSWRRMRKDQETIRKLTKERDEARRLYCENAILPTFMTAKENAKVRGWDCYKENNK